MSFILEQINVTDISLPKLRMKIIKSVESNAKLHSMGLNSKEHDCNDVPAMLVLLWWV